MKESTNNFQPTHAMPKIARRDKTNELQSVDGLQEKHEQGKTSYFKNVYSATTGNKKTKIQR